MLAAGQQPPQTAPATTARPRTTKPKVATVKPSAATTVTPAQIPAGNLATPQAITTTVEQPAMAAPRIAAPVATTPSINAQQPTSPPTVTTAQAPAARDESINEKGFKGKVFEVKYRDPAIIARAIQLLGSGFKGASLNYSDEFKTITVRDFPENIAAMEEAIKRLDAPQPARPDIEFRIQVLIASNTTLQGDVSPYPQELKPLMDQLLATLKYTNYALMFSANHRTKEGGQGIESNGVVEPKLFNMAIPAGNQIFYDYRISQISLDSSTSAGAMVQSNNFVFQLRIPLMIGGPNSPVQYQNVGFRSPVSLREGEKVVVGTTTMGDKGLIVFLSAKVNK
jgi:hypothetical protein